MHFSFQESKIWEGTNNFPDPTRTPVKVKARDENRARRKLPRPGTGRKWVLMRDEN